MNYYEHHIGDFLKKTIHLTAVEDGIYRRLLDRCYTVEGPLPADVRECSRLARAMTAAERTAVKSVLAEFFTLTPRGHEQNRANEEIARFQAKSAKAKESAAARWKGRGGNANGDADADADGDANAGANADANGMPRAPVPSPQPPDPITNTHSENASDGGAALGAAPPPPPPSLDDLEPNEGPKPPPYDGNNEGVISTDAIVALAPGWELPDDWGIDAEALGWKPKEVVREAERFRQYWVTGKGQGARRKVKGWRQTWSNWLNKAGEGHR